MQGDKAAFEKAAIKVKESTARLKNFVDGHDSLVLSNDKTWVSGYNRSVSSKVSITSRKYSSYQHHKNGTIVVTDDRKNEKHPSIPKTYRPYAVIETRSVKGTETQIDRTFYDESGKLVRQIHSGPHARLDKHPYGIHGEHAHDYLWQNGKPIKTIRELTDEERKESSDIIEN